MIIQKEIMSSDATVNTCRLCAPLGASLVFKGIENTVVLLHGSQGCATYIRRYLISHFREPVDIASSSFSEETAVFGGERNLKNALRNILQQYGPRLIGIATTCLAETIGEDISMYIKGFRDEKSFNGKPLLIHVASPAYAGSHADGFHAAVKAVVASLATGGPKKQSVNILPGIFSPADIRELYDITREFEIPETTILPDYSQTLDGMAWDRYEAIPRGGTPIHAIRDMGRALATIEFSITQRKNETAGDFLTGCCKIPCIRLSMPIGVMQTDELMTVLTNITNRAVPERFQQERGRLIDSYVDGHKYVFEKKAVLYGEADLVLSLARFCSEIGIIPVLCASADERGKLAPALHSALPELASKISIQEDTDFDHIREEAKLLAPDILIGSSKGYPLARELEIPLIRVGFPIHDRFGGQRILHIGYRGSQQLFDRIVNALIANKQQQSKVGYSYI